MKDVVIVANFVAGLEGKDNNRFSYLATLLAPLCNVELIVSDFYHAKKARREVDPAQFPFKLTMLHESGYPKNVCLKRFYSHSVFGKNVKAYLDNRKKPDVIYCAVPSLDAAKAAADYARENNIHFIVDVQDLWPEAFKMVFHVPVVSNVIFAPMEKQADAIYKQADEIVAVSHTYCQRAKKVNTKDAPTHTVFLGTRLADFDAHVAQYKVKEKPEGELWLAYCGTLGSSYDLTCVFQAMELLVERGITPPKFVVMGDGPRKAEFESYAREKNLNVEFTGRIPYAEMCGLLSSCDISVNPIMKGAAQSIINKHADYAASGTPVLNTQECQEYRDLVEEYAMGFNCENGNAADLADKLATLIASAELRREMGKNARRCAQERFDRAETYGELIDLILADHE